MFIPESPQVPAQVEAALQFLRFTEAIVSPKNDSGIPTTGRELSNTEFEVKDSALITLLEYFNQPILSPSRSKQYRPPTEPEKGNDLPF